MNNLEILRIISGDKSPDLFPNQLMYGGQSEMNRRLEAAMEQANNEILDKAARFAVNLIQQVKNDILEDYRRKGASIRSLNGQIQSLKTRSKKRDRLIQYWIETGNLVPIAAYFGLIHLPDLEDRVSPNFEMEEPPKEWSPSLETLIKFEETWTSVFLGLKQ